MIAIIPDNPTVRDNLARNSTEHHPVTLTAYAMPDHNLHPGLTWITPYLFPPFVTAKFGNISFYSWEILIVCFSMFVLYTYQFLSQSDNSSLVPRFFVLECIKKHTPREMN